MPGRRVLETRLLLGVFLVVIGNYVCWGKAAGAPTTITITSDQTTGTTTPPLDICGTDDPAQMKVTFRRAFKREPGESSTLDLIYLLDASQSVQDEMFELMKLFVKDMTAKLQELGFAILHYEHTRIAINTFSINSLNDKDGISDKSTALTACEDFNFYVDRIVRNGFNDATNLAKAMSKANSTLKGGRRVVFLFWDGDSGENTPYDGKTPQMWAEELKIGRNAKVFTVGIGVPPRGYLESIENKNAIQELAYDNDHYGCYETWNSLISNLTRSSTQVDDVKFRPSPVDESRCKGGCDGEDLYCGCDVYNRTYGCFPTKPAPTTPDPTSPPKGGIEFFYWIILGVAGFLILILVATTSALLCRKRDRRLKERKHYEENIYGGPPIPPPPIRKRIERQLTAMRSEPIYGNVPDPNIPQLPEGVDPLMHGYKEIIMPYEQVTDFAQLEQDMSGWAEFLWSTKLEYGLLHLGVRSYGDQHWAITSGFSLSVKETRELERALRQAASYKYDHIKIGGELHRIAREESSELFLKAVYGDEGSGGAGDGGVYGRKSRYRKRKEKTESMYAVIGSVRRPPTGGEAPDGGEAPEGRGCWVAWTAIVRDYVIVGVAERLRDSECQQAVMKLRRHLDSKIGQHNEAGDTDTFDHPDRY